MNRVNLLIKLILVIGFFVEVISAAEIELSGFCDLQYVSGKELPSEIDGFQYGQFEFNATAPVNRWITLQGALALNQPQGKFEPRLGYVDLNFLDIGAYKRLPSKRSLIKKWGMWIGQFDVPFGIDYKVSSSIDRALVHAPLVNERTIDSWNSIGTALYLSGSEWNVLLFGVNGFTDAVAAGGRIGAKLDYDVEVGFSYSRDQQSGSDPPPEIFGVDLQWHSAYFSGKGEIVRSRGIRNGGPETNGASPQLGFYFQGIYDVWLFHRHPFYLVGRVGTWTPENRLVIGGGDIGLQENRITAGIGVPLGFQSELRLEYMVTRKNENILTFQLAVGF